MMVGHSLAEAVGAVIFGLIVGALALGVVAGVLLFWGVPYLWHFFAPHLRWI